MNDEVKKPATTSKKKPAATKVADPERKDQILAACTKAMGEFETLSKSNFNKFDNYNFSSIDDFLAASGRICAANGLMVLQEELRIEEFTQNTRNGARLFLKFYYQFVVIHESEQTLGPFHRTVSVMSAGAQSYGGAQSYAQKFFLRSFFQIATGDGDDPDHQPPVEHLPNNTPQQRPQSPPPSKPDVPQEEEKVTKAQLGIIKGFHGDAHPLFSSLGMLIDWIEKQNDGPVESLTKERAGKLINFLSNAKMHDLGNWEPSHRDYYLDMFEQEKEDTDGKDGTDSSSQADEAGTTDTSGE